jgi:glycosidase
MPVTPISMEGKKGSLGSYYACSDYRAVNPEFGTLDDFKRLVQDAQKRGMKVIIDWVANHTGHDHVWTQAHPEYYKRNADGRFFDANGWDDVIDLDYSNASMRLDMIDAMTWWVRETGIDGFRCDMAMLVEVGFWRQARTALEDVKPLLWLAELDQSDNPEYLEVFDAAYTWSWMRATEAHYRSGSWELSGLRDVLHRYAAMEPAGSLRAWFTSNHDENTWNGSEYEKYGALALPLSVFSCTWDGIPLIYSGQELPNQKRLAFFDKDPIDWSQGIQLQEHYKKLLTLRQQHPSLRGGDEAVSTEWVTTKTNEPLLAFVRRNGERKVIVVLNFSAQPQVLDLSRSGLKGKHEELFTGRQWDPERQPVSVILPWASQVWVDKE